MPNRNRKILAALAAVAVIFGSGCSRSVLNYQIAESIGTLGQYENNEPVETPKMKAEREQQESAAALESEKEEVLAQAADLAAEYRYEDAVTLLENSELLQGDEDSAAAIEDYQSALEGMYEYDGTIPHFSFTNLVVDTDLAFDGDGNDATYRSNLITITEFENILQQLYTDGYILIDIHSLTQEGQDESGDAALTASLPVIPQGKKPMILSVDNLSFSLARDGDGVATRLVLDGDGEVAAVYTDAGGNQQTGAYDVVTVLEQFIAEHPDFSYQGARGIISLSGLNGAFGYDVTLSEESGETENRNTVRQIAAKLSENGWNFASAGYGYQYLGDLSYEALTEDITQWQTEIGSLLGDCDILMYPYGSEVDYSTEKGAYLINQGFLYLIGMWTTGDSLSVENGYLRQTRRMVTGYVLENSPEAMSTYFSVAAILDDAR